MTGLCRSHFGPSSSSMHAKEVVCSDTEVVSQNVEQHRRKRLREGPKQASVLLICSSDMEKLPPTPAEARSSTRKNAMRCSSIGVSLWVFAVCTLQWSVSVYDENNMNHLRARVGRHGVNARFIDYHISMVARVNRPFEYDPFTVNQLLQQRYLPAEFSYMYALTEETARPIDNGVEKTLTRFPMDFITCRIMRGPFAGFPRWGDVRRQLSRIPPSWSSLASQSDSCRSRPSYVASAVRAIKATSKLINLKVVSTDVNAIVGAFILEHVHSKSIKAEFATRKWLLRARAQFDTSMRLVVRTFFYLASSWCLNHACICLLTGVRQSGWWRWWLSKSV